MAFYNKSKSDNLDFSLFKNPTKEYRGAPFWAWNTKLEHNLLTEQIDALKDMGFGGFFIHSRSGLNTEYLGEEFMQMVKLCRDKAEKDDMFCYLYDEDKWPSGYAGGKVTKTPKYRQKKLYFSTKPKKFYDEEYAVENALPFLVGIYDVVLDDNGYLLSYRKITDNDAVTGVKRYAYVEPVPCEAWHNGFTPEDAMMEEAVKAFIDSTYEKYKEHVGESFGKSVPAIFTDEPQMGFKHPLAFSSTSELGELNWTTDFSIIFNSTYGFDLSDYIPELFLDFADGKVSTVRYQYHKLLTDLFTKNYSEKIGKWCKDNGILFTGHMMWETNLDVQTQTVGDATRAYEYFDIPGIDLLCDTLEIVTAKQVQSVVRQFDKDGFMTELYGVTNWDFDFRGHKFQGDWQAALGATLRVPHLAWVSMKGSAKRDYPASINYQVPWYKEYKYIEDHFARLNTVLTRGEPIVKVGVIHPIESYWLIYGPENTSATIKDTAVKNFDNLCSWLYEGTIDYDLLSEGIIDRNANASNGKLNVGKMSYQTVIVPSVKTLRRTTFELLKEFEKGGGKLVFIGDCPTLIDALPSNEVLDLYNRSIVINFNKVDVLAELQSEKTASIFDETGKTKENFVHQLRRDGKSMWFFLAHSKKPARKADVDVAKKQNLTIVFDGEFIPTLYDTISGRVSSVDFKTENGKTYIYKTVYDFDSLLIRLEKGNGSLISKADTAKPVKTIDFKGLVEYSKDEDNVILVDICSYRLNDGEFMDEEEILKIDEKVRKVLNYPKADGWGVQPYALPDNKVENYVTLKYTFNSKDDISNVFIAGEEAEKIVFNGKAIDLEQIGYYVDKSIKKYRLGNIKKGENELLITTPITHRISIENYYILGDFDAYLNGTVKTVCKRSDKIGFSDITRQGMPFYGGNLTYKLEIDTPNCDLQVRINRYRNACLKVLLDKKEIDYIVYPPYLLKIENVTEGKHLLEIVAYGNRVNTFGPVHDSSYKTYISPSAWYTTDYAYSYEYEPKATGILSSPVISVFEK